MADLKIEGLVKRFGEVRAVDDVSIHVADGEFVTLLGPSGCGKSTTLAAVAGLDRPDEGRITVGGKVYFDGTRGTYLPPESRGCGLVFQSYALWPHMTVADNVAFPLTLRKVKAAERKRRIAEVLALVEMEPYADRYPHMLSGGQQQRVALARTLVYQPSILLLDEPLSNLDAKLRDRARTWLAELRTRLGLTTIYVTHDQIEALSLSDRIVVMNSGRIAQLGTPQDIYERPADPFVADFIGTTNFLPAKVAGVAGGVATLELADGQRVEMAAERPPEAGARVTLAFRPEQMRVAAAGEGSGPEGSVIATRVLSKSYVGGRWQVALDLGGGPLRLEAETPPSGDEVRLWLPRSGCILFKGVTDVAA
ncbi:ABC transporter ATP-binding protein [Roseomonas terrae]|jgi:iron(III) transport system ATP-binding protein|uniref:ABC transporter ATP-binding protein n=1 Tax=Neoroseomonas terrae TaxID=424799 RepID=A0ABS5EAT1_9PROT|nr:ABC transporter ATP-binding protein [Neoroseomonas terrae]MBR0648130.1 ABC transporter ATP-binding protein [Neoroseomonas terrae]